MAGRLDQAPTGSAGTLTGRLDPLSVQADQEPGMSMPHPSHTDHPSAP